MVVAIRGSFRSASGSFDVELWLTSTDQVVDAAGELFANLQVRLRLDASSDRSAGSSVQQSAVLGGLYSVFDPSRMPLMVVKVSVSNFLRTWNDVGLSSLSGSGGLSQVDQVAGAAQNSLDWLVYELGLMAIGIRKALTH